MLLPLDETEQALLAKAFPRLALCLHACFTQFRSLRKVYNLIKSMHVDDDVLLRRGLGHRSQR